MSTNKKKELAPRKFVRRRGVARIDVAVNRELIEKWLDNQYSAEAIYKALIENGYIEKSYSYRTFLRALYSLIPKSKRSAYRPSKTRAPAISQKQQISLDKIKQRREKTKVAKSSTSGVKFVLPSNSITGEDE